MDVQQVFQKVAAKLAADFDVSAEIKHEGSKGTFREDALRRFLDERLPGMCATGSGEIVGPRNDQASKQCDLIVYDRLRGIPLVYGNNSQVYPIECVYGTIEVKSSLSKEKLLEGLESIRSVKLLVPDENVVHSSMPGFSSATARPRPFGIVFAYQLGNNSLNSLEKNLREWEAGAPSNCWPNLVVVLREGVILHCGEKGALLLRNEHLNQRCRPIGLGYRDDSLFHMYAAVLDIVSATPLGPPNIRRYYDLPKLLGSYSVKNHDRFVKTGSGAKMRLKEEFIRRIVTWCAERPKVSKVDVLLKRFGELPVGSEPADYPGAIHFYDPDNLPGLHEVKDPWEDKDGSVVARVRMQVPNWWIVVDGEAYDFAQAYISEDDLEEF